MWIERRCGTSGLVAGHIECGNVFGISDKVESQRVVSWRCEQNVLQIRTIARRSIAGNDRIRDGVGSLMARYTVTEAVRRHVLCYGAVNQRRADAGENAAAHAGSGAGRVAADGGVSKRDSGIVTDSASGAVGAAGAIAGCVATNKTARNGQRPVVEDAATAAATSREATQISVAGVVITDGAVSQTHCSLVHVYSGTPATTATADMQTIACTVVIDSDFVEDHGGGLTRKEITAGPHAATLTTVATGWPTAITGVISTNRDARKCQSSGREIDAGAAPT